MPVFIKKMRREHIAGVAELERASFAYPWSIGMFEDELKDDFKLYYVATDSEERILGYCGMWHIVNEGHITNIAVCEDYRRKGIASHLMERLFDKAVELSLIGLTLEVRVGNRPAQSLYAKLGFKPEGIRKRYYESGEDAVIMWKYFFLEEK